MQQDREQVGVLRLSTLNFDTSITYNTQRQISYTWNVDWNQVFGHADEDESSITYAVEHFFEGQFANKSSLPNAVTSGFNAALGFVTYTMSYVNVTVDLPMLGLQSVPKGASWNGTLTNCFTTIDGAYPQYVLTNGAIYTYTYSTSRRKSFICKSPRNQRTVTILISSNNNNINNQQRIGGASKNYTTTTDYFSSGVHTFIFYKLQRGFRIMREIDPEVIGTLHLSTLNSSSQSFSAATGTQMYNWNNVDWGLVLGHIPRTPDSVWEVTVEFSPNYNPSQSVATALGTAGINQNQYFSPVVFVASNLNGKNNTPNVFNTIATISYFLTCSPVLGTTWYQWVYAPVSRASKFVCYQPESLSTVTILTSPTFNGNYQQSAGVFVNVINSYPADYYTSGVYKFTFRRVKNKTV